MEDKISSLEEDLEYERELNANLEQAGPEIVVSQEIDDLERLREVVYEHSPMKVNALLFIAFVINFIAQFTEIFQ